MTKKSTGLEGSEWAFARCKELAEEKYDEAMKRIDAEYALGQLKINFGVLTFLCILSVLLNIVLIFLPITGGHK